MILGGVSVRDSGEGVELIFTHSAAKVLMKELEYSIEESSDHGFYFPIFIRLNSGEKNNSKISFKILPPEIEANQVAEN